ncbi:MAG: AraC family transcriptional regulator [Solobacterium sp.]|nr:AraC family transcriptional regulator [Solobacterium sp.]
MKTVTEQMIEEHFDNQETIPLYLELESVTDGIMHEKLMHWHNDVEVIHVAKGAMYCQTNEETFLLNKGDVCFINKNQVHGLYCKGDTPCEHEALIINLNIFSHDSELFQVYIKPLLEDANFSHIRFDKQEGYSKQIADLIHNIQYLRTQKELGYELEIVAKMYQIFRCLYQAYSTTDERQPRPSVNVGVLQDMLSFIYQNYEDDITLQDIANSGSVSPSTCNRIFNELTKMTPITFLTQYRLEKGAELLRNSTMSIGEIALSCGFTQQSYFNRLFLRTYGITPLKYRKNH